MSLTRNPQGSARARTHRVAFKTTRRVNAELDVMARALGLTRSGAAHWACLAVAGKFAQDTMAATEELLVAVSVLGCDEDWVELTLHLVRLGIDIPPWMA